MRITILPYLDVCVREFHSLVFSFKYPVLCVVILLRAGDYLEVLCPRKVCIEEPTAAGLPKGEPACADDIEMP